MTISKWNQYKYTIMNRYKSDEEKLIKIASLMRRKYKLFVQREPILLFDKDTCKLVKIKESITKAEYDNYTIHHPDLLFYIKNTLWIIEIDGWIHDTKNRVIKKDKIRNEHYKLSGINHIIISESKILHNMRIYKVRAATAVELWPVIDNVHFLSCLF